MFADSGKVGDDDAGVMRRRMRRKRERRRIILLLLVLLCRKIDESFTVWNVLASSMFSTTITTSSCDSTQIYQT